MSEFKPTDNSFYEPNKDLKEHDYLQYMKAKM